MLWKAIQEFLYLNCELMVELPWNEITEDNFDIEWGSIQMTGQTVSSGSYYSNYTLTKFNLSKSDPYIQFFHEWLVADMNHNPVWTNYWSSLF